MVPNQRPISEKRVAWENPAKAIRTAPKYMLKETWAADGRSASHQTALVMHHSVRDLTIPHDFVPGLRLRCCCASSGVSLVVSTVAPPYTQQWKRSGSCWRYLKFKASSMTTSMTTKDVWNERKWSWGTWKTYENMSPKTGRCNLPPVLRPRPFRFVVIRPTWSESDPFSATKSWSRGKDSKMSQPTLQFHGFDGPFSKQNGVY